MSGRCRLAVTTRPTRGDDEVEAALALRRRVFCNEQGIAPDAEFDGLDADAVHVVCLDQSGVIATCRLRFEEDRCKLERMAVEERLRGNGVGGVLLTAAEREAAERGAVEIVLHSQTRAASFYAAAGYRAEDEVFLEEGIPHVRMRRRIERQDAEETED